MIRYHVPRSTRIFKYWTALPHRLLKQYPEQVICYSTFGVAAVIIAIYKIKNFYEIGNKPWYRGYYDVVRSDDFIAKNWRKPEEYPAPYLTPGIETAHPDH